METSPFLHPNFIATVFAGVVALVVWFIRLESKAAANKLSIDRIDKEIERLKLEIEDHRQNAEIHFDKRITQQVDGRYNDRFRRLENDIHEIKEILMGFKRDFARGREDEP